ncbi:CsgG/HfaB family protein [Sphingomonas hominis]|nr:CsgG/HfaB family protein [Sphingomonas hominis]
MLRSLTFVALAGAMLTGCAGDMGRPSTWAPARIAQATPAQRTLEELPPAERRVAVAVYGFTDQTGQFKDSDTVQTLSRAVTQGATSILIKALQDAGHRDFFQVIERERLDNLLRERSVIREMRSAYLGETELNTKALPPLLFAGILLEGGIVGYDSNTKTGGIGARFLGIGGSTKYREDTVTVYLRAISTKTGEVLLSVNSRKQIVSVGLGADAFRYVGFKQLLEIDSGITYNEPVQLALQQAIEKSVYAMIMEGAEQRLWCFRATPGAAEALVREHIAERDHVKVADVRLPADARGRTYSTACPSVGGALPGVALPASATPASTQPTAAPAPMVQPLPRG